MKGVFKKTASIVLSALMLTGSLLPMTSQLSVQAATQQNIQAEFFSVLKKLHSDVQRVQALAMSPAASGYALGISTIEEDYIPNPGNS